MKPALALMAFAQAAHADPVAHWGASTARLHPCQAADACVTITNRLSMSPDVVAVIVEHDGLAVEVVILMGPGKDPDRAVITPPLGWIANPPWADLDEDSAVTFQLFAPLMG